jgi:inhibitor of KinA sporulation pathway (predicted exonuclease)
MDCEANTGETADGQKIPPNMVDMIQIAGLAVEQTTEDFKIVGNSFASFCRPRNFPTLTNHIKELTKIKQKQVDSAPIYPEVMHNFKSWRQSLLGEEKATPAFSGDWDMNNLLPYEQSRNEGKPPMDSFFKGYINLKNAFTKLHPDNLINTKPPEIVKNGKNYGRLSTESLMEFYGIEKIAGSQDHQADCDVQHIFLVMKAMHGEGYRWTEDDISPAKFMDIKYTECSWDE